MDRDKEDETWGERERVGSERGGLPRALVGEEGSDGPMFWRGRSSAV
jgi:hypothetical protein